MELQKCSRCHCNKLLELFHVRGNTGKRNKTCILCNSKFKCDKCDYASNNKSHIARHNDAVHDNIKDFKCDKCDYVCAQGEHLDKHIKAIHDKIKDFQCDKCEYTTGDNSALTSHIKVVHDKIKDYKCDKCPFTCADSGNLSKHIRAIHDKIKDYKCDKCAYVCAYGGDMKRHVLICTGELNISGGELAVRKALELMHIEYTTEVCAIPNSRLRFDFEIEINGQKQYIEYDGRQHFEPARFGGISLEQAQENLRKCQEHDKIKNEWCQTNGFPLLRISYLDFENIFSIIHAHVNL